MILLPTSSRTLLHRWVNQFGVFEVRGANNGLLSRRQQIGGSGQLSVVVVPFAAPYSGLGRRLKEQPGGANDIGRYRYRKYSKMLSSNATMEQRGSIEPVRFTKNMTFFTNRKQTYEKDNQSLRLTETLDKPLVFIFAWLQASEKHLAKYADFYLDQGFEVLCVHITPWQLVWPVNGSQKVATDVVKFLTNNDFPEGVVIHGFSVGGYLWGECLVKLHADPTGPAVLAKIRGQVWDSLADITEIPVGVPHAVLPHNPTLQGVLRNYINYHMKLFHEEATQYYVKCTHLFHYEPAQCPALLLVSKTDPVGTEKANIRLRNIWESVGVRTSLKCWDKSPHVGHFHKHRDEYIELLLAHLRALDLPMYNRKAKL